MSFDALCVGCFADLRGAHVCVRCGWRDGHELGSALALPPRTVLKTCYLVGRVLGQGGFGITYLAFDLQASRKVAIKEYLPSALASRSRAGTKVTPHSHDDAEYFTHGLAKFREEAGILAKLDHQSIVAVHDCFEENGTAYLVMDYLGELTLAKYLDSKGGRIPYETALKVLLPVMDGLREIHSQGLFHRDVSPDNICITSERRVKLIDFGAARFAIGERHPKSLSVIVKDGYAPAEQYFSRGVQGCWTDIYSLGATLYRATTGRLPPPALDRQQKDELMPPRRLGVEMPRKAERALLRALAVHPEGRFQSVAEMQEALLSTPDAQGALRRLVYMLFSCGLALLCSAAGLLLIINMKVAAAVALGLLAALFVLLARRLTHSPNNGTRS